MAKALDLPLAETLNGQSDSHQNKDGVNPRDPCRIVYSAVPQSAKFSILEPTSRPTLGLRIAETAALRWTIRNMSMKMRHALD